MSRYLVTGGLGVIGSLFARHMLYSGHAVEIIDSAEEPRNRWIRSQFDIDDVWYGRIEEREHEDIGGMYRHPPLTRNGYLNPNKDGSTVLEMVERADYILHAAASTGIPYSGENPTDDWERNVDGTRALLEALRRRPRPTVVLSSVKPYCVPTVGAQGIITADEALAVLNGGAVPRTVWSGLREDDVLAPDEPYAASKAAQSLLCQAYARSYGLPVMMFRCSNLAGAAPPHGPRHGWLTWASICAAIGRPFEVHGDGNQSRDILFAADVTTAVLAAFAHMDQCRGEIFNIGGGRENLISVNDAVAYLKELSGGAFTITTGAARKMDDHCVYANYGKFHAVTGWRPMVAVRDGVRQVYEWACEHREELRRLYENV